MRAFNKLKHHILAFPTQVRNKDELWVPARIKFDKGGNSILIRNAWLEGSSDRVRRWTADAIAAQAVLYDTLALILSIRYRVEPIIPQWVAKALETDYLWSR